MKKILYSSLLALWVITGCGTTEPQAINYGKDVCEHCKMVIADEKYGAELITKKGKVYKFDSAECLMDLITEESRKIDTTGAQLLVINFAKPATFLDAKTAFYLKDKEYQSPMGGNIVPFESEMLADNNQVSPDAEILTF
ncbi:MAG TPA: nitrous oxide reductase accessory protein NosL, partial [Pelobium sp.]|nr:nitrous oxide reductase accessory protein NosL [Pelobium sp.]